MIDDLVTTYLECYLPHDSAEEAALAIIEILQDAGAVLPGYELTNVNSTTSLNEWGGGNL